MKKLSILLCFLILLFVASTSLASTFDFEGYIEYHNDVVFFNVSLFSDTADVRIWTDSYDYGANFDPVLALWTFAGQRIGVNDDNPTLDPAQDNFDSGLEFSSLMAGNYLLSLSVYDNFPNSMDLASGFRYGSGNPIPIEDWYGYDPTGYYHVVFENVDAVTPVPEPATMLLFGTGLVALAGIGRRKFRK
jgi:hypothetical protein